MKPVISVIIPARNEELYIEKCLISILDGSYPSDKMEVFVVDGCSSDRTTEVVYALAESKGWNIRVINNPGKTQPNAMNLGIHLSTGKYVARADAHSVYQPDYLEKLVAYMDKYQNVCNIGGLCDVRPSTHTMTAKAIAIAYSNRFATGNALWRVGVSAPTLVDTVPFGFFRRDTFEKYGDFDADLPRNEDQEFNHRIIAGGGKVLLVPDVVTVYYARPTLHAISRMFYQYGWFKPLSQSKQRGVHSYRQFAPLFSLILLICLMLMTIITKDQLFLWTGGIFLGLYLALAGIFSIEAVKNKRESCRLVPLVCTVFVVIHVSFLIGNIKGILDFLILKKRINDIPLTR